MREPDTTTDTTETETNTNSNTASDSTSEGVGVLRMHGSAGGVREPTSHSKYGNPDYDTTSVNTPIVLCSRNDHISDDG